ncbi:DoxX family membrane protein [Arsenicicoccus dermatophilus]|uniref:DoxX family membrane protein n=1 Tax=Arsenicicoccus dermatophilus TaxID=1076331 RepID=UPI0039175A65
MPNPVTMVARACLGALFVGGGLNQLTGDPTYPAALVDQAKERYGLQQLPASRDLVRLNGALMTAGGAALALGIMPRRAALLLAGLLQPTNVVGHAFWTMDDPGKAFAERNHFMSNVAVTGGLLLATQD